MKKTLVLVSMIALATYSTSATVQQNCPSGSHAVLGVYSSQDAHVYEKSLDTDHHLCVSNSFDSTVADRGSGPSGYTAVLDISSYYDDPQIGGHVGFPGQYPAAEKQLFLKHDSKNIEGVSTACSGSCQLLASLYAPANSHVAEKGHYSKDLYVKLSSPGDPTTSLSLTHGSSASDTKVEASYSASSTSASITGCTLDWGDGSSTSVGTGGQKTHEYASSGTYTAVLTCSDSNGKTSTSSSTIQVPSPGSGGLLMCKNGNVYNQSSGQVNEYCGGTSSWSSCDYQTTCDEDGTQSRVVRGCSSGDCYSSTETRICTRDTDGKKCPAGSGKACNTGNCVDVTAPDTSDTGDGSWHDSQQIIQLNCDDSTASGNGGSGCSTTYYCKGSGCSPSTTGDRVVISDEGVNTLRYHSSDNSPHSPDESIQSTEVKIDYTNPETRDDSDNDWHDNPQTVTLTCEDPENPQASGCQKINYCVDQTGTCDPTNGKAFNSGSGSLTVSTEGVNHLRYQARDRAGNLEPVQSTRVKLDYTPPEIYIQEENVGDSYRNATVYCRDRLSGCQQGTKHLRVISGQNATERCPQRYEAYDIEKPEKQFSTTGYICGTVKDNVDHTSTTSKPIEIETGALSTGFTYPAPVMRTIPGAEASIGYEIKNLEESPRPLNVTVTGGSAELDSGRTSKEFTLSPRSRELLRVRIKPEKEQQKVTIIVENTQTGMTTSDTLTVKTREAQYGTVSLPGIGPLQIVFLLITATTAYLIKIRS